MKSSELHLEKISLWGAYGHVGVKPTIDLQKERRTGFITISSNLKSKHEEHIG
jgi:hypothetical protein